MSKQVNTADEQDEIQHMDYIYMVNDDKLMIRMNAELDHHLAEEMRQVIVSPGPCGYSSGMGYAVTGVWNKNHPETKKICGGTE